MLRFQVEDRGPDSYRQAPAIGAGRRRLRVEEAAHAGGLEARDRPPQRPLRRSRLLGALGRRLSEEHDRAQDLVGLLLGRAHQQAELCPRRR